MGKGKDGNGGRDGCGLAHQEAKRSSVAGEVNGIYDLMPKINSGYDDAGCQTVDAWHMEMYPASPPTGPRASAAPPPLDPITVP